MYAIQVGTKFAKVEYFAVDNKIWNVVISATAKTYKTQAAAQQDLDRMIEWASFNALRAQEIIDSTEHLVAKSKKKVAHLEAKLEELMDRPFREVERQVAQTRRAIENAASDARSGSPSVRSFKQDLSRYNRILSAGGRVVKVQQTVEAL